MAEKITGKPTCDKCGVDVRDGTAFCYNCGNKVVELPAAEGDQSQGQKTALPEPDSEGSVEPVKIDEDHSDKMARAAEQRRKSRVGLRKPREYAWEPTDDSRFILLTTLVIVLIALGVVFLTVFWK